MSGSLVTLAARDLTAPFETYIAQGTVNGVRYWGAVYPSSNPEIEWSYILVGVEPSPFPYGFEVEPDN